MNGLDYIEKYILSSIDEEPRACGLEDDGLLHVIDGASNSLLVQMYEHMREIEDNWFVQWEESGFDDDMMKQHFERAGDIARKLKTHCHRRGILVP
ncbi:hypothetical protein ACQ5SP_05435 [Rhodovulum sp. YNF3179]|uniref:hypothetical protein n=1 Tax=Rhodovulum sp. YNF3179 TaxID=3425127 RepID=UPI003D348F0C